MHRVVITGIGVVSPFGVGRECFWEHVRQGCSATRALADDEFGESASRVAAPVSGVSIEDLPALEGDEGARAVLRRHHADIRLLEVDDAGVLFDIDRKEDVPSRL